MATFHALIESLRFVVVLLYKCVDNEVEVKKIVKFITMSIIKEKIILYFGVLVDLVSLFISKGLFFLSESLKT